MLFDHWSPWSLLVISNISEKTYFTLLFYISYSILYLYQYIKLKVDCLDPHLKHVPNLITSHNKAMLIILS